MAHAQSLPQLLELLHRAFKAQQHYAQEHPKVQQSTEEALDALKNLLALRSPLVLNLKQGRFVHDGKPVLGAPNAAQALAEDFLPRQIGGLAFHQGLTLDELQLLFFAMQLRPERLEEMGGAEGLLLDTNVTVLPLEGDALETANATEPAQEPAAPAAPQALPAPPLPILLDAQAPASAGRVQPGLPVKLSLDDLFSGLAEASVPPSPASLAVEIRSLLQDLLERASSAPRRSLQTPWGLEQRESLTRAGFRVPAFKELAGVGLRFSLGRMDPITLRESLRAALSGMEPIDQGSVLLGMHTIPDDEQALRRALDYLAPELLAQALAAVHLSLKPSIFELALIASAFLQCVKDFELSLESIRGRLQYEGWGVQEVDQLREAIVWESHGTDTKMRLGVTGRSVFELDPNQVMIMNRQLIRRGREADLRSLLSQLDEGFSSPSVERRRQAMSIFADLAECLEEPGLSEEIETRMCKVFREFIRTETDQQALLWSLQAHEALLGHWLRRGHFEPVYLEILALGELILPRNALPETKVRAIQDMLARLGGPLNLAVLVPMLHDRDREISPQRIHALLALMGRPAANYLVVCLELEEDRARRQQLLAALLSIGRHAVPALTDALASPQWYLVRNAAMLLGEIGGQASVPKLALALGHRDVRVRKATVHSLATLGGPDAVAALVKLLDARDLPVLMDVLAGLGDLHDPVATAAVSRFLLGLNGSGEEVLRLRLRAVETLGRIASPDAVEPLLALFRKKSFLGGRESTPIRLAAAKALAAIGTREAREATAVALEAEPQDEVRSMLRAFLVKT